MDGKGTSQRLVLVNKARALARAATASGLSDKDRLLTHNAHIMPALEHPCRCSQMDREDMQAIHNQLCPLLLHLLRLHQNFARDCIHGNTDHGCLEVLSLWWKTGEN